MKTICIVMCIFGCVSDATTNFNLTVHKDGSYDVIVGDKNWLRSSPTFMTAKNKRYSVADGSLELVRTEEGTGIDVIGPSKIHTIIYQPKAKGSYVSFSVYFKRYTQLPLVVFGQHFDSEGLMILGTNISDRATVSSGFPSFYVEEPTVKGRPIELGYLAYGGIMTGDTDKHVGRWSNSSKFASGLDSGPLVVFDAKDNAIIISPFSNFMSGSAVYGRDRRGTLSVSWGVIGSVRQIPEDFRLETVMMYSGDGINELMDQWGDVMRAVYQKDRSGAETDLVNNYLGYWTDNGAYYYYLTESNRTYEDTIIAVKYYADLYHIPYRYVQYDSWFYPKGHKNGVTEWTAMKNIFPHGLQYVWEKTGWPVIAHNRWWSNDVVYAKQNGGEYNFAVETETKKSLPIDQTFWDDLMANAAKWGLVTYEQDWLNVQFDQMDVTVENITLGRQWLHQMAKGAAKSGITVQYCMSPSRHALTSLELPAVTQIRVSNDYQPGENNWKIGISSMFAHALGLAPFKDNFWTSQVQDGNVYNRSEPHSALHSLVATLSTGPVGPSDRVGKSNVQLIMRSCNEDGLILKPSKPATAINKQIINKAFMGFSGEVYSTHTVVGGFQFGIVVGAGFNSSKMTVTPKDAGIKPQGLSYKQFSWNNRKVLKEFSDDNPISLFSCSLTDFCLVYLSPILYMGDTEVIILGEVDKWVPMSPKRVTSISVTTDLVLISLAGAVGEYVSMFIYADGPQGQTHYNWGCRMGESGTAAVQLTVYNIGCVY